VAVSSRSAPTLPFLTEAQVLSAGDLAQRWSCTVRHVQALAAAGRAPLSFRIGRLRRWRLSAVERFERDAEDLAARNSSGNT